MLTHLDVDQSEIGIPGTPRAPVNATGSPLIGVVLLIWIHSEVMTKKGFVCIEKLNTCLMWYFLHSPSITPPTTIILTASGRWWNEGRPGDSLLHRHWASQTLILTRQLALFFLLCDRCFHDDAGECFFFCFFLSGFSAQFHHRLILAYLSHFSFPLGFLIESSFDFVSIFPNLFVDLSLVIWWDFIISINSTSKLSFSLPLQLNPWISDWFRFLFAFYFSNSLSFYDFTFFRGFPPSPQFFGRSPRTPLFPGGCPPEPPRLSGDTPDTPEYRSCKSRIWFILIHWSICLFFPSVWNPNPSPFFSFFLLFLSSSFSSFSLFLFLPFSSFLFFFFFFFLLIFGINSIGPHFQAFCENLKFSICASIFPYCQYWWTGDSSIFHSNRLFWVVFHDLTSPISPWHQFNSIGLLLWCISRNGIVQFLIHFMQCLLIFSWFIRNLSVIHIFFFPHSPSLVLLDSQLYFLDFIRNLSARSWYDPSFPQSLHFWSTLSKQKYICSLIMSLCCSVFACGWTIALNLISFDSVLVLIQFLHFWFLQSRFPAACFPSFWFSFGFSIPVVLLFFSSVSSAALPSFCFWHFCSKNELQVQIFSILFPLFDFDLMVCQSPFVWI